MSDNSESVEGGSTREQRKVTVNDVEWTPGIGKRTDNRTGKVREKNNESVV